MAPIALLRGDENSLPIGISSKDCRPSPPREGGRDRPMGMRNPLECSWMKPTSVSVARAGGSAKHRDNSMTS
eukprot:scaffold1220_cov259-Pinguiococcus_pyrenoidosus.AAC.130